MEIAGGILVYLIFGFVFYKGFYDGDTLDVMVRIRVSEWKRIYRVLLKLSVILLWPIYLFVVFCIIALLVILCLKEEIIKFFK